MALLPAAAFRRVSLLVRFILAVLLLVLLSTSFVVPHWLTQLSVAVAHRVAILPPISLLGLLRTVWGRGGEPFVTAMTRAAVAALGAAFLTTILAYTVSFRRSFMRIPETPDTGPLPRVPSSFSALAPLREAVLRTHAQRACYLPRSKDCASQRRPSSGACGSLAPEVSQNLFYLPLSFFQESFGTHRGRLLVRLRLLHH